jgi:hypothetical protein
LNSVLKLRRCFFIKHLFLRGILPPKNVFGFSLPLQADGANQIVMLVNSSCFTEHKRLLSFAVAKNIVLFDFV